jgi:SMC interacting uncharacterized protein involved in chromosome segregation
MTDWLWAVFTAIGGVLAGGFGVALWAWLFRRPTDRSVQVANYAKAAETAWEHMERVQAEHARQIEMVQIEVARLRKQVEDRDSLIARQTLALAEQAAEIARLRSEVSSLRWQLDHQGND